MTEPQPTVEILPRLSDDDAQAVLGLVAAVDRADGAMPLSEHVRLHLRHGGDDRTRNLLVRADRRVVAYAHLDVTDRIDGPSAELAVAPSARGRGLGRLLVETLLAEAAASGDPRLRLWSHGRGSPANTWAADMGFVSERVLWQMRRSLLEPLAAAVLPAGLTVRTFRPGVDEPAWVAVNNRAFADHPDQGGWTVADVEVREAEPWFDPAGFFLAEADWLPGRLAGFHWTKVHGAAAPHERHSEHDSEHDSEHGHDPIGEVYVVGVDPDAQGRGLGRALTLVGLQHLQAAGLTQAMLYVDESNTAAIRTYTAIGFNRWDTDVCYRRP